MASITRKITGGTTGAPFQSAADEIAKVGGVEEEFLFEGTATQYRLAGRSGSDYPADGRWDVEPMSQAPFRSRRHVLRPGDPERVQRHRRRGLEQRLRRPGQLHGRRQGGAMIEDGFALVGVDHPEGRRRRSASGGRGERVLRPGDGAAPGSEGVRPRAVRHARAPRRRVLLRHLHPGRGVARAGPAARDRPDGRPWRRAPGVDGRVAVGVSSGDLLQRDPADHLGVRRIPHARLRRHAHRARPVDGRGAAHRDRREHRSICSPGAPSSSATTWRFRPSS